MVYYLASNLPGSILTLPYAVDTKVNVCRIGIAD